MMGAEKANDCRPLSDLMSCALRSPSLDDPRGLMGLYCEIRLKQNIIVGC